MLNAQKKNRVMHIVLSLGTGGMEKLVCELAGGMSTDKFIPVICCLAKTGRFSDELEKSGIKVFCMDKKPGLDFSLFFKVANILKEEDISVVHSHDSSTNLYASIAARMAGIKNVFNTEHGGIHFETARKKFVSRFLCFLNKKVICVSESIKNDLISMGLPSKRLKVIPNSLDFSKYDISVSRSKQREGLGLCDSSYVISYVGRLSREKNHKMFLDSVKPILSKVPQARFLIVGDGPLRISLEEYAKSLGIYENVVFLGIRKDIPEILKASDCFAACSNFESFGLSVLEAMAAGIPVVSTCAGGLREIVKDKETGILIAKNDVAAFVNAVSVIREDAVLRERIISNAKTMVKNNYKIEKMIKDYEDLYIGYRKN